MVGCIISDQWKANRWKKFVLELTKIWPGLICFILPYANGILNVLIWGFPHSNSLITPAPAVHNWDSPSSCETGRRGSPGPSTQRTSPSLWGGAPGGEEEQRRNAHNAGVTWGHWTRAGPVHLYSHGFHILLADPFLCSLSGGVEKTKSCKTSIFWQG